MSLGVIGGFFAVRLHEREYQTFIIGREDIAAAVNAEFLAAEKITALLYLTERLGGKLTLSYSYLGSFFTFFGGNGFFSLGRGNVEFFQQLVHFKFGEHTADSRCIRSRRYIALNIAVNWHITDYCREPFALFCRICAVCKLCLYALGER